MWLLTLRGNRARKSLVGDVVLGWFCRLGSYSWGFPLSNPSREPLLQSLSGLLLAVDPAFRLRHLANQKAHRLAKRPAKKRVADLPPSAAAELPRRRVGTLLFSSTVRRYRRVAAARQNEYFWVLVSKKQHIELNLPRSIARMFTRKLRGVGV
jgi:hypothetical protein